MVDLLNLSTETYIQVSVGGLIVFQIQRLIKKVDHFAERLTTLETEHKFISGSCRERLSRALSRETDMNRQYQPID